MARICGHQLIQVAFLLVRSISVLSAGARMARSNCDRVRALRVFADGVEIPIVIPSGNFGTNDTIEFYGFALDTPIARNWPARTRGMTPTEVEKASGTCFASRPGVGQRYGGSSM